MVEPAIRIRGLGKRYTISHATRSDTLREAIGQAFRRRPAGAPRKEPFWALRDVDLDVSPGEIVGVIGPNGAGKSTLLKILSRVTDPTTGRAEIRGRVGSLLEVGIGFHPELSGRENIYLNGSLLGMRRGEIDQRFDQIVAFSGVEKFLEMPVKRYSSGMYVRLAFAVAAHFEPDVLLVDEVLAVGDAAFQRKSFDAMRMVAEQGRTVMLVTHNLGMLRSIANRTVWIEDGRVQMDSRGTEAVQQYVDGTPGVPDAWRVVVEALPRPPTIPKDSGLRVRSVRIGPSESPTVASGEPFEVEMDCVVTRPIARAGWGFYVETMDGLLLLESRSLQSYQPIDVVPGAYRVRARFPKNPLGPGRYRLGVGARSAAGSLDWVPGALHFTVVDRRAYEDAWLEQIHSVVNIPADWDAPTRA